MQRAFKLALFPRPSILHSLGRSLGSSEYVACHSALEIDHHLLEILKSVAHCMRASCCHQGLLQGSRVLASTPNVVPPPRGTARLGSGPKWETPKYPMKRLQNWTEQNDNIQENVSSSNPQRFQHPRPCQIVGRSTRRDTKHNSG